MDRLTEAREAYTRAVTAMHTAATAIDNAPEDVTPEQLAELDTAFTTAETEVTQTRETVERYERTAAARAVVLPEPAPEPTPTVEVTDEPLTYRRGGEHSFFTDLLRVELRNDRAAQDRLSRHMVELRAERPEQFALSSTDAAGGQLISPIYLNDQFVDLLTAGRTVANVIGSTPLPGGTDSINVPNIATGTTVADQADNTAVSATDMTFGSIAAAVLTKAGMQDASMQLVDRSVPGVDEVIYSDLVKRYNIAVDSMVITSATANNLGLLNATGLNAITYTDASPTLSELYPKIADGVQQIHTGIFMPPSAIFMHPRRWAFCLSSLDTQNRPLITPYAPMNGAGVQNGVTAEGPVGSIQGVPVYTDANIPINLGVGTNEDRIIICRADELWLWEETAGPFMETFRDVLSGTLGVRFRLHNYVAQMFVRRPKAISVISGTGLITPTF